MKFAEFKIENFKGIDNLSFNLEKSPEANIYTLVGLNESGKTTILEAINLFNPNDKGLNALEIPGTTIKDYNILMPISARDNFNGRVAIEVKINLDENDKQKINEFVEKETPFRKIQERDFLKYYRYYYFADSKFQKFDSRWTGFSGVLKDSAEDSYISIGDELYPEVNNQLSAFCNPLIPNILYFPNFLFDFPAKVYLEAKAEASAKQKFYFELIQDILYSLENSTNITTHLVERIKSNNSGQKKSLARLIQLMERKITDIVFEAWNKIFKRKIKDTRVIINYDTDNDGLCYLEFEIEAEDGIYQINEKSLGFKWFFIFLLFTQFRPFRKESPKNILFLFDEPASNLHSTAQTQLLKSFENLIGDSKIIYTTHSHHLINPNWLESTYVVKNEGLNLDNPENSNFKKTKITILPYREFASKHPHNTAYFQPILDVLDYSPSNLEMIPNCVFLEGKNDFYTLSYFKDVLLKFNEKLNLSPSTSSSNLDTLISLYLGWGKDFIVLLDSDQEAKTQKERYIKKFGILVEDKIFELEDIDATWRRKETENLFEADELLTIQQLAYPSSPKFNKTQFNRAIQENLISKREISLSKQTLTNFEKIITFLCAKINFS